MAKPTFARALAPCFLLSLVVLATCARTRRLPDQLLKDGNVKPKDIGTVLAFDSEGRKVLAGSFLGDLILGNRKLTATSGTDAFVARLDKTGKVDWIHHLRGLGHQTATGVAVDRDNATIVAGLYEYEVTTDKKLTLTKGGGKYYGIYVAKVKADGKFAWSRALARLGTNSNVSVAIDPAGKIVIGTTYLQAMELDGQPVSGKPGENQMFVTLNSESGAVEGKETLLLFGLLSWSFCHSPFVEGWPLSPFCENTAVSDCAGWVCAEIDQCCNMDGGWWGPKCVEKANEFCPKR